MRWQGGHCAFDSGPEREWLGEKKQESEVHGIDLAPLLGWQAMAGRMVQGVPVLKFGAAVEGVGDEAGDGAMAAKVFLGRPMICFA